MEDLTKQQIILLTLFVSFVTSIATGIVTVSLMGQAPTGVIQTINKVIERTVEKAVPSPAATTTIVKETVVVSTDDLVVSAIDQNVKTTLRIFRTNSDPTTSTDSMVFVSLGIVISEDGIIATDRSLVSESGKYFTTLSDGKLRNLSILRSMDGEQIALLKVNLEDKESVKFHKAAITNNSDLKLGQTVIYIGGESKSTVSTGIISGLGTKDDSNATSTNPIITSIETNISSASLISGATLVNLSGEVIGVRVNFMNSSRTDLFVPSKAVTDVLSAYNLSQKKP
ncbi:MAG: serine protease [Candidatus Paceibacterota bacterium]|jgi:S1-C subfamily serine protease